MLFDKLIFPDNSKKEKNLKELHKQICSLFDRYKVAWNEFAIKVGPQFSIPQLEKSITNDSIDECLQEMNSATEAADKVIHDIIKEMNLINFNSTNYNQLDDIPTALMNIILKSAPHISSLSTGIVGGYGVCFLIYKKIFPYTQIIAGLETDMRLFEGALFAAKKSGVEGSITQVYADMNKVYSDKLVDLNTNYDIGLKNPEGNSLADLQKGLKDRYIELLNEHQASFSNSIVSDDIALRTGELQKITSNLKIDQPAFINGDIEKKLLQFNSNEFADFAILNVGVIEKNADFNIVMDDHITGELLNLKIGKEPYNVCIFNNRNKTFYSYDSLETIKAYEVLGNSPANDVDFMIEMNSKLPNDLALIENEAAEFAQNISKPENLSIKSRFWISSTLSAIAITILMEILLDIIIGYYSSNKLDKKIHQLNDILNEITSVFEREIQNLSQYNQSVIDGTFRLDENYMLVANDNDKPYILDIRNIID